MSSGTKYIPALRFSWLTPLYDPVLQRLLPELLLKQRLIAQARFAAGQNGLPNSPPFDAVAARKGSASLTIVTVVHPSSRSLRMEKDPVCGMDVEPKQAAGMSEYQGQTYYFCSPGCKKAFDKNPSQYVAKSDAHDQHQH